MSKISWLNEHHHSGLYEISKNFPGRSIAGCGSKYGVYPGASTPIIPDEPDALDAGGGVEGVGAVGLASGGRVSRAVA